MPTVLATDKQLGPPIHNILRNTGAHIAGNAALFELLDKALQPLLQGNEKGARAAALWTAISVVRYVSPGEDRGVAALAMQLVVRSVAEKKSRKLSVVVDCDGC